MEILHKEKLSIHHLADGVRTTSDRDGGTVLDIGGNKIYRLNPVGNLILQCVREGWDEAMIAKHISNECSIAQVLAESDVHAFLKLLREQRLIHEARQPEEP